MLNVALLSHSPHLCGGERMLLNLAVGLAERGRIKPLLFIPKPETGPLAAAAARHGIEHVEIPSPSWYYYETEMTVTSYWSRTARESQDYRNVLRRHALDVAVVNTLTSLPPALACMKLQLPYVAWVHGIGDAGQQRRVSPVSRVGENLTLHGSAHAVACSEWTARHFRHRAPCGRVTAVANWTEVPAACPREPRDMRRFACLSTLEKHKGLDVAIRAVGRLRAAGRKCFLDIYGDGAEKAWYKQIVHEERLKDAVRFFGRTDDVNKVYRTSLATVFPSRIEPFGMLAVESMAQQTPVIASAVGGLCEIIDDGRTGMLFESGNVEQLAACMAKLLEDPREAERLGQAGYQEALARFNGEASLGQFESVLRAAAAAPLAEREQAIFTELLDAVGASGLLEPAGLNPHARGEDVDPLLSFDPEDCEHTSVAAMAAATVREIRRRGLRRLAHNAFLRGAEFLQHGYSRIVRRIHNPTSGRA